MKEAGCSRCVELLTALGIAAKAGWRNEFERGYVACNFCDATAESGTGRPFVHRGGCLTTQVATNDLDAIKDACDLAIEVHAEVRG